MKIKSKITKLKVGDLVKVNEKSEVVYRVSWLEENGFRCAVQERKPDGTFYSEHHSDISLFIPA